VFSYPFDNPFMKVDETHKLVKSIKPCQLKLFSGGGHMLPITMSDEVNGVIEQFFGYSHYPSKKAKGDSYAAYTC
jgi:hypothetical protein